MSLKRLLAIIAIVTVSGCASAGNTATKANTGPISVVTTISVLNSFVQAVGGSRVRVQSLVPVGASPETYQPTPQDVALLSKGDLLVENGAGLETWLDRTVSNAGRQLRIVVCSNGLPVKNGNPHLWMDPQLAKRYVFKIRDALIEYDPQHEQEYRFNARRYAAKLDDLTKDINRKISRVPQDRRFMIVFHNAWQYYNDRFGITTLGFIEANPGQDPNPQDIARLVDAAKRHHLHAIFGEPEYSPKLAQQLAGSAGIAIVDNLYDDSIGTDPRVRDYIGMLRYDTGVILSTMQ